MESHVTRKTVRLKHFEFPEYWEEIVESIQSADQLLVRLRELEDTFLPSRTEHITAYVEDKNGDTLHIGLAGDSWMITHIHPGDEYEYLYAVGDEHADGYVAFLYPEWTEIPLKRLIPSAKAREVVREWVETGRLNESIRWTDEFI